MIYNNFKIKSNEDILLINNASEDSEYLILDSSFSVEFKTFFGLIGTTFFIFKGNCEIYISKEDLENGSKNFLKNAKFRKFKCESVYDTYHKGTFKDIYGDCIFSQNIDGMKKAIIENSELEISTNIEE